jgi:hypothetical protein
MEERYFQDVVNELGIEELHLLGFLYDNEATVGFKALKKEVVMQQANLSEAVYRRIIGRLSIAKFIESVNQSKHSALFVSEYGVAAIQKSLNLGGSLR